MRAIFETGYSYGWRISEVLNLRVKQVDLANRLIRLETGSTKNKRGRVVKMTEVFISFFTSAAQVSRVIIMCSFVS